MLLFNIPQLGGNSERRRGNPGSMLIIIIPALIDFIQELVKVNAMRWPARTKYKKRKSATLRPTPVSCGK